MTEKTQIQSEVEVLEETESKPLKGWNVIVFNDDHHSFDYVINVFCKVLEISVAEARELAKRIHEEGKTVVAGPMSKYEASSISNKISSFGPDPMVRNRPDDSGLSSIIDEVS